MQRTPYAGKAKPLLCYICWDSLRLTNKNGNHWHCMTTQQSEPQALHGVQIRALFARCMFWLRHWISASPYTGTHIHFHHTNLTPLPGFNWWNCRPPLNCCCPCFCVAWLALAGVIHAWRNDTDDRPWLAGGSTAVASHSLLITGNYCRPRWSMSMSNSRTVKMTWRSNQTCLGFGVVRRTTERDVRNVNAHSVLHVFN